MAAAICRHLARRGLRVAPFKAQNMSNNSHPLVGGGEIGRAQMVQAEACGIEASSDMNPILLKPTGDAGCQVVVNGKVWKDLSARAYYARYDELLPVVVAAYERLAGQYEYIVIEGAGSVAELNFKSRDLVNFGFATRVGAPALLVADIERGGVFASILGTLDLLEAPARALVRSFAVNRFRGDLSLFDDGRRILEDRSGTPCLGVFPMLEGVKVDAEDSLSFDGADADADIAVIALPRISNATDFQHIPPFRRISEPDNRLYREVVIPGTKNTTGDLEWLRNRGLDVWIKRQHAAGAHIIGICGGYQMLGEWVEEPNRVAGLGLLPVRTVFEPEKTTRRVIAKIKGGVEFEAYEIHMGITERPADANPFAQTEFGDEGIQANGCTGTYLHGALEMILSAGPRPPKPYDQLADWFESAADIELFERLYL
jgi:adenosylcobyric acid synthase